MVTETERQSLSGYRDRETLIGDKDRDSHCVVTETAERQSLGGDRDSGETITEG